MMLYWSIFTVNFTLISFATDWVSLDLLFFGACLYFFFLLVSLSDNIVFFLRTLILVIVGTLPYLVKMISTDALFGFHLAPSQTKSIAGLMLQMTTLAVVFNYLGLIVGRKIVLTNLRFKPENGSFFLVCSVLLFISAVIIDLSLGASLFSGKSYAESNDGLNTGLGNLNVIANTLVLFCFIILAGAKKNSINRYVLYFFIFTVFYLVGFVYIGHGVRMDALNCILGVFVIYRIVSGRNLAVRFNLLFLLFLIFIVVQFVGVIRNLGGSFDLLSLPDYLEKIFVSLWRSPTQGIYLYQGTINDISTTFSGIIYLIKGGQADYLFGASYVDYVLRTPPSFIYPNRPEALAWIFNDLGYTSGGGFFELAEAFYNFGVLGVVAIPFIISLILSISMSTFLKDSCSVFKAIPLVAMLAVFLRGSLYQNFAFYKTFVTAFLLYFVVFMTVVLLTILTRRRKPKCSQIVNC